ncbi:hypothetical protein CALCODRAFT_482527 [Calocera cornea HHB12733]|uniref:Uncharacterized protein n=1 Tax=Calocera cornea HHB12733 TaxID=1353952 RepID=A0A165GNC5_9BASI|nr:hypothetical protein CALCODRAFT_482527 [Calocera cornea HHB12733]
MPILACLTALTQLNDLLCHITRCPPPSTAPELARRRQLQHRLHLGLEGLPVAPGTGRPVEGCECHGAVQRCAEQLYTSAIALCADLSEQLAPVPLSAPSPSSPPPGPTCACQPSPTPQARALDDLSHQLLRTRRLRNLVLPPVSRLPEDILAYVFSIPYHHWDPGAAAAFADRIVAVSHLWREVALATPQAWANIVLGHEPLRARLACSALSRCDCSPRRAVSDRRAARGRAWISRAKAVPVAFDLGPHARVEGAEVVQCLMDSIAAGLTPVRALSWGLPFTQLLLRLAPACPGLQELRLARYDSPLKPEHVDEVLALDLPALRAIELRNIPLPRPGRALARCTALTLVFGRETVSYLPQALALLAACPALEHLAVGRLDDADVWADTAPLGEDLVLPRLATLALDEGRPDGSGLLSLLRTPALRELRLSSPHDKTRVLQSTGKLVDALRTFLAVATKLEHVEFPYAVPHAFFCMLKHLPCVRVLGFAGSIYPIADFFTDDHCRRALARDCAALRELRVLVTCDVEPSDSVQRFAQSMAEYVRCRREAAAGGVAQLDTLSLTATAGCLSEAALRDALDIDCTVYVNGMLREAGAALQVQCPA